MSTQDGAFRENGEKTNHIPGIYNYCDRWCERCPFTSRCLNFEMSEEKFGDLENVDITNEVFWQKLNETFAETLSMLKEMAAEKGIDDEDTITLTNSVEVIRWYQHQIYVKLRRALHSAHDEATEDDLGDYPKDSDGSTKVSLIGMDRSMGAWGKIRTNFPDEEDSILGIIAHLDRLRRRTETEFPDARAFVRPGFDEANPGS